MKNASLSVAIMACAMLTACAAGVGGPRADPPDHLQDTPGDRDPSTNIDAAGLDKLLRGHVQVKYSPWWGGTLGKAAYATWFGPDGVLYQCDSTDSVNFGPTMPVTYTLYDDMHWKIYDDPRDGAVLCVAEKGKFDPKHTKDCYPIVWDTKSGHMTAWSYEKNRWMVTRLGHFQTTFPAGLAKQCPGLPKSVPINRKQTATDYKTLFKQDPDAILTGAKLGIKDDPKWADEVRKWQQW